MSAPKKNAPVSQIGFAGRRHRMEAERTKRKRKAETWRHDGQEWSCLLTCHNKAQFVTADRGFTCVSARSRYTRPSSWVVYLSADIECCNTNTKTLKQRPDAVWSCLRLSDWLHTAVCGGNINVSPIMRTTFYPALQLYFDIHSYQFIRVHLYNVYLYTTNLHMKTEGCWVNYMAIEAMSTLYWWVMLVQYVVHVSYMHLVC